MPPQRIAELLARSRPLICAHRVNTRARLLRVLPYAPHMIELDVNTVGKSLVAMHGVAQPPLRNPIARAIVAEVERLIVGDPHKPVSLRELLEGLEGVALWLDVKKRGVCVRAVEEVYRVCNPSAVALSTAFYPELKTLKREHPEVAAFLGNVSFYPPSPSIALEVDADGISIEYHYLDRDLVEMMHGADLLVAAWTVNDEQDMESVVRLGIDILITDFPDVAREVMERLSRGHSVLESW
ncbi:MAG: glycerophosphodiester phosphodiesterase [Crenarchaeota archaeon]|nr:glycerophosphodiester phosphodiesterase [Thermoproteota archaeon]